MTTLQVFKERPKSTRDESSEQMIARLIEALEQNGAALGLRVVAVARPHESNC